MAKRPFIRKQKRQRSGTAFWDSEYQSGGEHLALSEEPSEDLQKFTRWLARRQSLLQITAGDSVVDFGCGNGRNLIYLAEQFSITGIGYDTSAAAVKQATARAHAAELPLTFITRSIAGDIPLANASQTLALDMMSSHFLSASEREALRDGIARILVPGGWLFMKTHLRDDDLHSARLLKEFPAKETGSYIHPVMKVSEHVYFEEELIAFLEARFTVHKVYRSHKHKSQGRARKRRTISVYAQKPLF